MRRGGLAVSIRNMYDRYGRGPGWNYFPEDPMLLLDLYTDDPGHFPACI